MKLLERYNRVNLGTTIVVLFFTGIIYYWAISYILNHQIDKDIRTEETEILNFIRDHGSLPAEADYKDLQVKFTPVKQSLKRKFINAGFYNKREQQFEAGRGLITSAVVNGENIKIEITESKVETEDLISIVFMITIGVIIVLVVTLLLINRFLLGRMWQPFYHILKQVSQFNLSQDVPVRGEPSAIDEFNELNQAVEQMAARVKNDYRDLKAFTENAAHELLTPIAVIGSKLDSLLQTGHYNEDQSKLLDDVYGAVYRLTRLNQSLLLLVKIENGLVSDDEQIELKPLIEEKINEFKELFGGKELEISCSLSSRSIRISRQLADILFNNLFSNAMRHNYEHGQIRVVLDEHRFMIRNTGTEGELSESEILKRFSKSSGSEGTGLGLTIVKQICDNYQMKFAYSYQSPYHSFEISLPQ